MAWPDGRGEWGFIHPGTWTEGEGGEVCADGDKTTCPWCGESVIVRRKADVRKRDGSWLRRDMS